MQLILFYIFALICVASAVMVVSARNAVHSVLFLILAFFNASALFVLIGAEFLAMVLVVVYVGAVAVLFMFVVMMLNINFVQMREGFLQYLPIGAVVGLILLVELILVGSTWVLADRTTVAPPEIEVIQVTPEAAVTGVVTEEGTLVTELDPAIEVDEITNTEMLGNVLYTEYFYLFQTAGAILLVAIIGAITLTLRSRGGVRRQSISRQVHRDPTAAVEMRKVKNRAGI